MKRSEKYNMRVLTGKKFFAFCLCGAFFFFVLYPVFASEDKIACPQCGYENLKDDRYCLECLSELRPLTEKEKKDIFEQRKENVLSFHEQARDHMFKAQNTANKVTAKNHYELARSFAAKALSEGGEDLSPALKKDCNAIIWVAKENITSLRDILKNPFSRVKLKKVGHSYFVDVIFNDKVEASLHLDTGCSSTLLSPAVAEKLDITEGTEIDTILADGSKVKSKRAFLKKITVGEQSLKNIPVIILETSGDGLLGMSFLRYFKFQVDTKTDELFLQRK